MSIDHEYYGSTDPAKAPEPTLEPTLEPIEFTRYRVQHGTDFIAPAAPTAVPAQVAPYKCNVPECTPNTYCHECVTHLKDGMGHQFYCSKAATEAGAQPVSAPSPEIPAKWADAYSQAIEFLESPGEPSVVPVRWAKSLIEELGQAESALRVAREERDRRHTEIQQPFIDQIRELWKSLKRAREARKQEAVEHAKILRDLKNTLRCSKASMVAPAMAIINKALKPVSGSPERLEGGQPEEWAPRDFSDD